MNEKVAVIGGGNTAVEEALYLSNLLNLPCSFKAVLSSGLIMISNLFVQPF